MLRFSKFPIVVMVLVSTSVYAAQEFDVQTRWAIQTARVHGAASSVSSAAAVVEQAAVDINTAGRLHGLARIHDSIQELNRQVGSAVLACEVLSSPPSTQ